MAVRIRLKKMGRTHRPFFRVCAMDSRAPRDGRVIEQLGTYDPMVPDTDARAVLNGERINYWLSVGAQPTPKVGTLIKKYGAEGTHLEVQAAAIAKLGSRRAASIEAARSAASKVEMPKPEPEAKPEDAAATPAEGEAAATKDDAPAAEAPAKEAKAKDAKAKDAKAKDAKAKDAKAKDAKAKDAKAKDAKAKDAKAKDAKAAPADKKSE